MGETSSINFKSPSTKKQKTQANVFVFGRIKDKQKQTPSWKIPSKKKLSWKTAPLHSSRKSFFLKSCIFKIWIKWLSFNKEYGTLHKLFEQILVLSLLQYSVCKRWIQRQHADTAMLLCFICFLICRNSFDALASAQSKRLVRVCRMQKGASLLHKAAIV